MTSNFYGNHAYASPNAHLKNVLSRRDDFYCLLYFLSHLLTNELLFFDRYLENEEYAVDTAINKKIN